MAPPARDGEGRYQKQRPQLAKNPAEEHQQQAPTTAPTSMSSLAYRLVWIQDRVAELANDAASRAGASGRAD